MASSSALLSSGGAAAIVSARASVDAESAALAGVLERVREQHAAALRVRGSSYWRGAAERRFAAGTDELAATLARARAALETALDGANRAASSLAVSEARLAGEGERDD